MKSRYLPIAVLGLALAACGGGPGATTQPGQPTAQPGQPTAQPGQPTAQPSSPPVGQPTPPPAQPGSGSVSVTLAGGPDAGTYTASGETNCSLGIIGPQGWGVQFSLIVDVGPNDLSSLQIVSAAPGMADDDDAFFTGTEFLMTATIGDFLTEAKREYEVAVRTDAADKESSGTGSATVSDTGSSAVIHATGTTADGVGIDATVNCPSVTRQ